MTDSTLVLRRADNEDLAYAETLLRNNDLPAADVRSKPDCFYVGRRGGERVGVAGLERRSSDALVRSVVVEASSRDRGVGTAIYDALEAEAAASGVETLYLLTTTAAGFFEDRGFEAIERSEAPPAIRGTDEFEALCPASATCLRKRL